MTWGCSRPTPEGENDRGDHRGDGENETAGGKLYESVSGPLTVAVYECAAEGVPGEGSDANGSVCRFEIRVNGKPVAIASSQMEAEQVARRIVERGHGRAVPPDEPEAASPMPRAEIGGGPAGATETSSLTSAEAAAMAADVALANECLTSARLLLATDRVGDEAGHTVDSYLTGAQESTRRIYSVLTAARGVRPAETGTGAGEAGRRRLLCLLEQAREVADCLGDAGGADHARGIGELALRVRAEAPEVTNR